MDHLLEMLFDLEQQEVEEYKSLLQAVLEREFGRWSDFWMDRIAFQEYLMSQA